MSNQTLDIANDKKEINNPDILITNQSQSPRPDAPDTKNTQMFDDMLKSLNGELKPVVSNEVRIRLL